MAYPVLIIGFNRPNLLKKRISEVLEYAHGDTPIIISIDGPRELKDDIAQRAIIENIVSKMQLPLAVRIIFRDRNYGCSEHIILAVTEVLNNYDGVIVIEDDIRISPDFIPAITAQLESWHQDSVWVTVGAFSPFVAGRFLSRFVKLNHWRHSFFFSAWGWGVKRDLWHQFEFITNSAEIDEHLKSSVVWNSLSERRKVIWRRRFGRGIWDFQMQLFLFKVEKLNKLPYFRLIDNEGFESSRSTHTRHKRPWNFFGIGYTLGNIRFSGSKPKSKPSWVWRFIDSNLWAADGHFNSRARTKGIRTIIRQSLFNLTRHQQG